MIRGDVLGSQAQKVLVLFFPRGIMVVQQPAVPSGGVRVSKSQ